MTSVHNIPVPFSQEVLHVLYPVKTNAEHFKQLFTSDNWTVKAGGDDGHDPNAGVVAVMSVVWGLILLVWGD